MSTVHPSAISAAPITTGHTHTGTHISTSNTPSPISAPASNPTGARPDGQHGPVLTRGNTGLGGHRPACGGYRPGGRAHSPGGLPHPQFGRYAPGSRHTVASHLGAHVQRDAHRCMTGSDAPQHGTRQSHALSHAPRPSSLGIAHHPFHGTWRAALPQRLVYYMPSGAKRYCPGALSQPSRLRSVQPFADLAPNLLALGAQRYHMTGTLQAHQSFALGSRTAHYYLGADRVDRLIAPRLHDQQRTMHAAQRTASHTAQTASGRPPVAPAIRCSHSRTRARSPRRDSRRSQASVSRAA